MTDTPYTVRKATRDDAVPISDLLHRLGLTPPAKDEQEKIRVLWDWLWEDNPYYTYFDEEKLYGWVMEDQGRIVGYFGCIPRVYHLDGEAIRVAVGTRWGVEKPYRTHTYLLSDAFYANNPIDLKITTTAIKPSARIFEKYGGIRMPIERLGTIFMVPLDPAVLIDYAVHNGPRWKYLLGKLAAFPFRLINPVGWLQRQITADPNFQNVSLESLGADHAAFWAKYLAATKGLIGTRDPELVKWYYKGSADRNPVKCFVYREGSEVTGLAVLSDEPAKGYDRLKRYKVVDLITLNPALHRRMVRQLIRRSRLDGAHILEFHLLGMVDPKVLPFYTITRKPSQFPAYYQCTDADLLERLKPSEQWHVSPFDADTCLV